MSRHILLANVTLAGRTGTEIVTRDLALGLRARGYRVSVYAPSLGEVAEELAAAGVTVVSSLDNLTEAPDLVHGHHHVETVEALDRYPSARGVFVCHDRTSPHSIPSVGSGVSRFVAVDENCLERLVIDWRIPADRTRLILNAVDLDRFLPRLPLPPRPERALVFSHYASPGTHADAVHEACARVGLPVDVAGAGAGMVSHAPERLLRQYDIVFAKARCALEAMAVGCAVVLCDATGMGPMVTSAEWPRLRAWNFGARVLGDRVDVDALVREIRRYDAADASRVSKSIREAASLAQALDAWEALYAEVLAEPAPVSRAGVRALTGPLLERIGRLEHELAAYERPDRMLALGDDALPDIRIAIDDVAPDAPADTLIYARVRLANGLADRSLGSWPPFPLQWAYRWRRAGASDFLPAAPGRAPLVRGVPAGETGRFAVKIVTPSSPGRYELVVTLVQEHLRWLDAAATPVCARAVVTIQPRGLPGMSGPRG